MCFRPPQERKVRAFEASESHSGLIEKPTAQIRATDAASAVSPSTIVSPMLSPPLSMGLEIWIMPLKFHRPLHSMRFAMHNVFNQVVFSALLELKFLID